MLLAFYASCGICTPHFVTATIIHAPTLTQNFIPLIDFIAHLLPTRQVQPLHRPHRFPLPPLVRCCQSKFTCHSCSWRTCPFLSGFMNFATFYEFATFTFLPPPSTMLPNFVLNPFTIFAFRASLLISASKYFFGHHQVPRSINLANMVGVQAISQTTECNISEGKQAP